MSCQALAATGSAFMLLQAPQSTAIVPQTAHHLPTQNSLCSPKIQIERNTTASEILATFSPKSQSKKTPQPWVATPQFPIAMTDKRGLRYKPRISYEISDDSDGAESPSAVDSIFSSPEKPHRFRKSNIVDLEEEVQEIEPPKTPPPRISAAGHSLRQHSDLHLSLRAQENGDKTRFIKKQRLSKPARKTSKPQISAPSRTVRNEIRDNIATETASNRANFFIAKKEYFLPLLPEGNHIQRLTEQPEKGQDEDLSIPYQALDHQPKGVKAIMKSYQLSGLSFLVYLHKNGLSGILGDEMGLGKTLQTLSLIQYLKETKQLSGFKGENRPCLVVCPLSVLSSWIAEARKWTPGLKVLRFHGPIHERNRLKKVATGEEDKYGNTTKKARKKKNDRRTATGKPIIDLDSESDESSDEQGVDLVVTTYEGYQAEQSWFKRAFVWSYVVLDEGHKIKNDLSNISKSLHGLGAEYRLILTGTPLQNNLVELWALLHWLYPEVFTEKSAELFRASFDLTRGKVSTTVMDDSRCLLELIMLRRMKNSPGVELNLPPKIEVLLFVPLTPMQRFWYTRLLTRADQGLLEELFQGAQQKESVTLQQENLVKKDWENKGIEELEALASEQDGAGGEWEESKEIMRQALEHEQQDENKKSAWRKLMNILMQLRKCCNHPYLLPHAEPEPYYIGDHVIHASAKFIVLDKIIDELVVKQKKKVLIFSGFTRMLDCCEDFLSLRGGNGEQFKYARLDGGTSRARRNLGIRMFNQAKSEYRVMLISTRAGGLGINLATASDVIMLDQDWNPQIMLQAEARAHRIGQTNPVTIYKICTQGTVEEQMMGRIQKKLYLSAKVTESMRDINATPLPKTKKGPGGRMVEATDNDMPQMDTGQLMSFVRRGAQALAHPELDVNEMLGWDWPTMLDKCKDKPADVHVYGEICADAKVKEEDERKWLSQMEQVESRVFQGKRYTKEKELGNYGDISQEWAREERRKGKNTTVMIDGYAVSKESMFCGDWEAVPTMAGKDPRLAEPKREKKPAVVNQEHCQVCWDGGDLILCSGCPRSYHYQCLDKDAKARSRGKMNFNCTQHHCFDCLQKTSDAGGMIYRCRWCERGYCEDCLDWDKTDLLGENLKEYELLGFPAVTQAFYIQCPGCTDHHCEDQDANKFCEARAIEIDAQHQSFLDEQALIAAAAEAAKKLAVPPSRAESLTDATTLDDSGICTPKFGSNDGIIASSPRKRKAAPNSFKPTPSKRSKRITA